jgi:hypothetical protein
MKEALNSSETLVLTRATKRNNPEADILPNCSMLKVHYTKMFRSRRESVQSILNFTLGGGEGVGWGRRGEGNFVL